MNQIQDIVKTYYGETLSTSNDLKTDACTRRTARRRMSPRPLRRCIDAVASKYYGCGLAIPSLLEGLKVLDLGCGAGARCVCARQTGRPGRPRHRRRTMTDAQLDVAREHEAWHAKQFGYDAPNTRFVKGYLETLGELDLEPTRST